MRRGALHNAANEFLQQSCIGHHFDDVLDPYAEYGLTKAESEHSLAVSYLSEKKVSVIRTAYLYKGKRNYELYEGE